jgi:hypothetical protein
VSKITSTVPVVVPTTSQQLPDVSTNTSPADNPVDSVIPVSPLTQQDETSYFVSAPAEEGVTVGVTVLVGVFDGVLVGVTVLVGVFEGVLVGVIVGVNVGVTVLVGVGVAVLVAVTVGVGEGHTCIQDPVTFIPGVYGCVTSIQVGKKYVEFGPSNTL